MDMISGEIDSSSYLVVQSVCLNSLLRLAHLKLLTNERVERQKRVDRVSVKQTHLVHCQNLNLL